jgi:hypothetical protein
LGVLVPEDLDLATIGNAEERQVVEACVHGLSDGWLVLPNVAIQAGTRHHELDVVLIHEQFGLVDLEVKGHRPELRQGVWYAHGRPMDPQPREQAKGNSFALRDFLHSRVDGLGHLKVPYAVVLPNTRSLEGQLGSDLKREQVITGTELEDIADAVERLAFMWATTIQLDGQDVAAIVSALRPDADFVWDPDGRQRFARRRLDDLCASQVRALETLDANPRVLVRGGAGTGKTRLAEGWARRALWDDRRVLLTCYNEPLAGAMAQRVGEHDELVVGPFLRLALGLPGMPPLAGPASPEDEHEWWTTTVPAHLSTHWDRVEVRFDTIVVDEGQDFPPEWVRLLERLLDPETEADGGGRLLVVADEAQDLYGRGFDLPGDPDRWARCELVSNCRNALAIARMLRRHLGGAAAPAVAPEAIGVRFVPVAEGDRAAVSAAVGDVLDELLGDEGRDPARTAVLTFTSALRDQLHDELALARWEERDEARVLGENVHRVKGLERDTVVLAADAEVADHLLYVGVSRAVSELVVVAPPAVGERLGLA